MALRCRRLRYVYTCKDRFAAPDMPWINGASASESSALQNRLIGFEAPNLSSVSSSSSCNRSRVSVIRISRRWLDLHTRMHTSKTLATGAWCSDSGKMARDAREIRFSPTGGSNLQWVPRSMARGATYRRPFRTLLNWELVSKATVHPMSSIPFTAH